MKTTLTTIADFCAFSIHFYASSLPKGCLDKWLCLQKGCLLQPTRRKFIISNFIYSSYFVLVFKKPKLII